VGEETELGTDPRLAKLRAHLAAARAQGLDFSEAWDGGRQLVLAGMASWRERQDYSAVLAATRASWCAAYEGQPSDRVDDAATVLAAFAQDVQANLSAVA
jgi:hypothetical protein